MDLQGGILNIFLMTKKRLIIATLGAVLGMLPACQTLPGDLSEASGDEIVVAGDRFHTTVPVVLWTDKGGYDAYRGHRHDQADIGPPRDRPDRLLRFGSLRRNGPTGWAEKVQSEGTSIENLTEVIDTVVIHYDACGSASRCFHVLHDLRGLSCHFLLDVDGTIYQTLDVKERAWHAGTANDRSIGIEIAHFGAFPKAEEADRHYEQSPLGVRLKASSLEGTSAEGAYPYPSRQDLFTGVIHQQNLYQRDFTEAQYVALEKLLITLCKALPSIRPVVPRSGSGEIASELRDETPGQPVAGIVGHWHVGSHKVDPGPAFDWDRIEAALQEADLTELNLD